YGLQTNNTLQEACKLLKNLTASATRFSKPAQVSIINSLIYLSEQLLKMPFQNRSNFGNPVNVCPSHPPKEAVASGQESWENSKQDSEQVDDMLETSLVALGNIQEAFLQLNQSPVSAVTLTSPTATLMLSSQNISTLPLSSYTLGYPAPVKLCFPSASALEELLNKHPAVNVQVTGLALNPFKDFGDGNIVGSIGSVLLSSNRKLLQVRDLMEDIEVGVGS
ncbi:polycystic kidney disease protein 1-like 3, partial [Otolemur garnettii]|uniref:polycystic kidney disease protein 1-like 3 n=1 Tax=Otolemur garnettii TaxID=30611 RepID=UPI000C7E90EA